MKLYTKRGDNGITSLIDGSASKASLRVDSYGTVDELNSYINIVIAYNPPYKEDLLRISHYLFKVGYDLALTNSDEYLVNSEEINWLETRIDYYQDIVGSFTWFVLPGGSINAAHLNVARTISRRAERLITELNNEEQVNKFVLTYINRISDFLYILSLYDLKYFNHQSIKIKVK